MKNFFTKPVLLSLLTVIIFLISYKILPSGEIGDQGQTVGIIAGFGITFLILGLIETNTESRLLSFTKTLVISFLFVSIIIFLTNSSYWEIWDLFSFFVGISAIVIALIAYYLGKLLLFIKNKSSWIVAFICFLIPCYLLFQLLR